MRNKNSFRPPAASKKKFPEENGSRLRIFSIGVFVIGALLAGRLYFIQVASHTKWVAIAQAQYSSFRELSADRGEIFMRDGPEGGRYPLAVNREYQLVYVAPKEVVDKERVASELARVLAVDESLIRKKLDIPNDPFEIIKKRLTDDEVRAVQALRLTGVGFVPEKYRYYPAGELAASVVGFLGLGDKERPGSYGVEASYNETLMGQAGEVSHEQDAGGRWIPLTDRAMVAAQPGNSVVLTLDRVIQYETEKILKDALTFYGADSAQAIVMEPSGAILAMASQPQFDPNQYETVKDYSVFLNPAVSVSYEPGSIMKPLTMAIGIEEGRISPTTEYTDTGSIVEAGYTIRNSEDKIYGRSNMTRVLENSINTGVIYVERLVGNVRFREYLERFGFGTKTEVELPAELPGNLRNLKNPKANLEFFTASFGQGITVTPLQMTNAYAALANGGTLYRPRIVESVVQSDGREERVLPEPVRRVVSEDTSRSIGEMLESVVINGHGKRAAVPGYRVGGKTGTAQVAKTDEKGYESGVSIGSFVGYAPIDAPRFVVFVKLDNPKTVEWAESSAAPTFGRIMRFLLEYAKVPPTENPEVTP